MRLPYLNVLASVNTGKRLAMLIITLGIVAGEAGAASGKSISKLPCVITKPGLYVLNKDLTTSMTAGDVITIQSSNVILDFNGHSLTFVPPSPGASTAARGIVVDSCNYVTVRNGVVAGFFTGLAIGQSTEEIGLSVQNMTVNGSRRFGIVVSSIGATVERCAVLNTTNSVSSVFGIEVLANNAHVADCFVFNTDSMSASASYGIAILGVGGTVENNRIVNPSVKANTCGILNFGSMFINNNHVASMSAGINADANSKLANNLTCGCSTPFIGGTLVTGNN